MASRRTAAAERGSSPTSAGSSSPTAIRRAAADRSQTIARFCATGTLNDARGLSAGDPQDRLDRAVDELAASRAQLARVGNNLNQIAFALNAHGFLRPAELDAALGLVRRAVSQVDTAAAELVGR
ncbi:plasmid mobilization relaxosome protein MobC [Streptomyces sp. 1331.2]|uniref:plasmid mobilization relaxosome protein MobC n=1 Tax=Streptomyces sp. 1331.2 TaxID=1938835 RepID=UPI000BC40ED3|nr:plasmid mobilization relaxosome protein MobC [Streptomyces sp. 1331.2]SOB89031.1 mobilisation protein (MobC) [Streptomyces sp. 1331.2]